MLFVYLMLVAVGYIVGRVHGDAIRWARRPPQPSLAGPLPIALARAARHNQRRPRPVRGLDVRDQVERLGEPPSFEPGGSDVD